MKDLAQSRFSFDSLVVLYQSRIFAYIRSMVRDPVAAEELTQQTFVDAFRSIAGLRRPESFAAWLLRIAQNRCRLWFRARGRTVALVEDLPLPEPCDRSERVAALLQAVELLPVETREMLRLRYRESLTCEQIARRLGRPLGTVMSEFSRTYEKLRLLLKEGYDVR
jgi:RNA polymerase sigma-70 factor (ECF subfamily)